MIYDNVKIRKKKTIKLLFYNIFYSESEICKQLYNI